MRRDLKPRICTEAPASPKKDIPVASWTTASIEKSQAAKQQAFGALRGLSLESLASAPIEGEDDGDIYKHRSTVRRSHMDEEVNLEEKRRAFELKQAQQCMLEMTGGNPWRLYCDHLMEHGLYQTLMTLCTFGSIFLTALEADYHSLDAEPSPAMVIADSFLVVAFACDIAAKVYVYQVNFPRQSINVFEAGLLVVDLILQCWPDLPRIAGALKVLRFVRMTRILRKLSGLRELYLMMMGIAASIRAVAFGAGLLLLATTIFSVLAVYFVRPVCHRLYEEGEFGDCDHCVWAFDSVMLSNLTFFKTIVAGDSWGQLAVPIMYTDFLAGAILLSAWTVLGLGLLNTIAAVIIDRQTQARVQDLDYMAAVQAEDLASSVTGLMMMFKEFDGGVDSHSALTEERLVDYYDESPAFRSLLNRLDIHRPHVPVLFRMFDTNSTDDLTFAELVHGLHNLKNENSHTVAIFTKHYCETLLEKWADVEEVRSLLKQHTRRLGKLAGNMNVALKRLHTLEKGDPQKAIGTLNDAAPDSQDERATAHGIGHSASMDSLGSVDYRFSVNSDDDLRLRQYASIASISCDIDMEITSGRSDDDDHENGPGVDDMPGENGRRQPSAGTDIDSLHEDALTPQKESRRLDFAGTNPDSDGIFSTEADDGSGHGIHRRPAPRRSPRKRSS
eukprot:TRINITY_DN18852_c0_g2_i1.p1 TRINITY_DN18852_c0_g2~~TRINITY_DN18852_c0_g2_i1.p1  ORF type:complete len:673 (-),score=76.32 TRINITY_DN18852_c0_g2_i1:501-2519(-)